MAESETASGQQRPDLTALGVGLSLCWKTLTRRWPALLAGVVGYLALGEGIRRVARLLPDGPEWMQWPAWGLASVLPYVVFTMLGVFASLQVLAVADARPAGLGPTGRELARRLSLGLLLAVIAGGLTLPLQAYLHSLADTLSTMEILELAKVLYVLSALITLLISVFTHMAMPVAVDRDLSAWRAVRAGAALGWRRWRCLLMAGLALGLLSAGLRFLGGVAIGSLPHESLDRDTFKLAYEMSQWPGQVLTFLAVLYWPALYVALRPAARP